LAGETEVFGENLPSATSSTTNPTRPDLNSNSGRRGGKPATNRLSYGTACNNSNTICCDGLFMFFGTVPMVKKTLCSSSSLVPRVLDLRGRTCALHQMRCMVHTCFRHFSIAQEAGFTAFGVNKQNADFRSTSHNRMSIFVCFWP
jgi:hypothetical protein